MRAIPATARSLACPGLVPTGGQQSAFCGTCFYSGGLQGGVQEAEGGSEGGGGGGGGPAEVRGGAQPGSRWACAGLGAP